MKLPLWATIAASNWPILVAVAAASSIITANVQWPWQTTADVDAGLMAQQNAILSTIAESTRTAAAPATGVIASTTDHVGTAGTGAPSGMITLQVNGIASAGTTLNGSPVSGSSGITLTVSTLGTRTDTTAHLAVLSLAVLNGTNLVGTASAGSVNPAPSVVNPSSPAANPPSPPVAPKPASPVVSSAADTNGANDVLSSPPAQQTAFNDTVSQPGSSAHLADPAATLTGSNDPVTLSSSPTSVSVPAPIVGAGIPGLLVGIGIVSLVRRRLVRWRGAVTPAI